MKRALPPNVYEKAPGRLYYFKRPGPWVRLRSEPFSSDWYAEIARASENKPILTERTVKALIVSYQNSPRWTKLKPGTRRQYQRRIERIKKIGHLPVDGFRRVDILRIRDKAEGTPHDTNFLITTLKVLFEHAIDLGWIEHNPAKSVSALTYDKQDRKPWPQDLVDAFLAAAGPRERLICELCIGTGQRIGDVLKMQWRDVQNGLIHVKQGKTGKELWIPITPRLQAVLDATERAPGYIVQRGKGNPGPLSYDGAHSVIKRVRDKIGAQDYSIHAWRHTATSELVEAGCTDDEVASITGHSPEMVRHYSKHVRQKVRALTATEKRGRINKERTGNVSTIVSTLNPKITKSKT